MASPGAGAAVASSALPLVPAEIGRVRFDATKTLWLWGMAVPGLVAGVPALTSTTLAVSLALAFLRSASVIPSGSTAA